MNDQLNCLAKIIVENLAPDYSKLIAEIRKYEFVTLTDTPTLVGDADYKVLFVTSDTAVVQQIHMTADPNQTRFHTLGIHLAEWSKFFVRWIVPGGGHCYESRKDDYDDGYRWYTWDE